MSQPSEKGINCQTKKVHRRRATLFDSRLQSHDIEPTTTKGYDPRVLGIHKLKELHSVAADAHHHQDKEHPVLGKAWESGVEVGKEQGGVGFVTHVLHHHPGL